MESDLISKKDLLAEAGISYGQLYRWKRKGLIPEEWFIRKSTFTGQETFFPRDKVIARVGRILSMKNEDLSLEDIADAVAPDLGDRSLTPAEIRDRGLASGPALDLFAEVHADADAPLVVGELAALCALDELLRTGEVGLEEGRSVLAALVDGYPAFEGREVDLLFVRKLGLSTALLMPSGTQVAFEPATRVVARLNLSECTEALVAKIR